MHHFGCIKCDNSHKKLSCNMRFSVFSSTLAKKNRNKKINHTTYATTICASLGKKRTKKATENAFARSSKNTIKSFEFKQLIKLGTTGEANKMPSVKYRRLAVTKRVSSSKSLQN